MNIGHFNYDVEKSLMSRFNVQSFPTISVFGSDKESPIIMKVQGQLLRSNPFPLSSLR